MKDKRESWSGEVAPGANDEPNVERKNRPTKSRLTNYGEVIVEKVRYSMKGLVANELYTIVAPNVGLMVLPLSGATWLLFIDMHLLCHSCNRLFSVNYMIGALPDRSSTYCTRAPPLP